MAFNKYLYLKYLYWRWIQCDKFISDLNPSDTLIKDYIKCELDICKEIENILSNKYPKLYKDVQLIMNREDSESLIQSRVNGNYYSSKNYSPKELQQLRKWSSLGQRWFKKRNICRFRDISESKRLEFEDCVSRVQREEREEIMKDIRKKNPIFVQECRQSRKRFKKFRSVQKKRDNLKSSFQSDKKNLKIKRSLKYFSQKVKNNRSLFSKTMRKNDKCLKDTLKFILEESKRRCSHSKDTKEGNKK